MEVWMIFLFKGVMFRFHVVLRGVWCTCFYNRKDFANSQCLVCQGNCDIGRCNTTNCTTCGASVSEKSQFQVSHVDMLIWFTLIQFVEFVCPSSSVLEAETMRYVQNSELRTQNCCTSIVLPWLRWAPARGQVLSPNLASECWNERRACLIAPNFRHCGWPFGEVKRLKEQLREMALTPAKEIPKTDGDCLGSQKVRLTDSNYEAEQENVRYFWNMFVTVLILDIFVQNLFAQHFKQ